jgi:hypothetical protein
LGAAPKLAADRAPNAKPAFASAFAGAAATFSTSFGFASSASASPCARNAISAPTPAAAQPLE